MNTRRLLIPIICLVILILLVYLGLATDMLRPTPIRDFNSCLAYGDVVVVNGVRECTGRNGDVFREVVEEKGLLEVTEPELGKQVSSPLEIKGRAKGTWFFEGSFPIDLISKGGVIIGKGTATALGDWMTKDFVSFSASVPFSVPTTTDGMIVFKKDNPSGLKEFDDSLSRTVIFVPSEASTTSVGAILGE